MTQLCSESRMTPSTEQTESKLLVAWPPQPFNMDFAYLVNLILPTSSNCVKLIPLYLFQVHSQKYPEVSVESNPKEKLCLKRVLRLHISEKSLQLSLFLENHNLQIKGSEKSYNKKSHLILSQEFLNLSQIYLPFSISQTPHQSKLPFLPSWTTARASSMSTHIPSSAFSNPYPTHWGRREDSGSQIRSCHPLLKCFYGPTVLLRIKAKTNNKTS